jgi:hypothetical protein
MYLLRYVFAFGTALTMSCAIPASPPITGQWGGDHVRLTLDASGGRIEYDCGAGTLDAALQLDAAGRFSVNGKHEDYSTGPTSGPTPADITPVVLAATYRGKVEGDQMSLTVNVAGDKTLRSFNLIRGKNVKLIRCR